MGAEIIVPDVVRRLSVLSQKMAVNDLRVWFIYGMTETGGICWTEKLRINEALERLEGSGDPVSVGHCVTGWALRIVDDEGGPVSPGAAGNIEVRSDTQLFAGYKNAPELNALEFHCGRLVQNRRHWTCRKRCADNCGPSKGDDHRQCQEDFTGIDRRGASTRERHPSIPGRHRCGTVAGAAPPTNWRRFLCRAMTAPQRWKPFVVGYCTKSVSTRVFRSNTSCR